MSDVENSPVAPALKDVGLHAPVRGEFTGQTAIVTGAGGGLGRAISCMLASRGAHVALVDINSAGLEGTAEAIAKSHGTSASYQVDVTSEESIQQFRNSFPRTTGDAHILINNAGGWRHSDVTALTKANWDWTFDVNARSVLLMTRAVMDLMKRQRYGRIVNIGSTNAYEPRPQLCDYAAAKAAVLSLTKSLALELAPHQILVNAVSPGAIATELAKSQGWLESRLHLIPLGRVAEPDDVAEVVLFLASSRNRIITGESVMANGGFLMI